MSYFRPHDVSPALIWAGRAAALGGLLIGGECLMANVAVTGITGAIWPLVLAIPSSIALWRNSEKSAQINHDNRAYKHATDQALKEGRTEAHLPTRMLDKSKQVSGLATGYGAAGAIATLAIGSLMLAATVGSLFFGLGGPVPGLLNYALEGAAFFIAGIAAWEVTKSAKEARDFAYSGEAEAERARIAKDVGRHAPAPPQPSAPTVATPLSDRLYAEQQAELAQASGTGKHAAQVMDRRQRIASLSL